METKILWGKELARETIERIAREVQNFQEEGKRSPGLAVILVGNDPASQIYVSHKERACEKAGIHSMGYRLPSSTSMDEMLNLIDQLNKREEVDGILVQLPLPSHLDPSTIIEAIDPVKDVDGFHPLNMGKLALGEEDIVPCTPKGVMALLDHYGIEVEGQEVVVVGASNIVGKPLSLLLVNRMATVTVCHIKTQELALHTQKAQIIFTATGVAHLIKKEMVPQGVIIFDIGISRINGKIVGDADFEGLQGWANAITPVPGGVGPMTVAMLMVNTLEAYKKRINQET
ncbi:MAG TPA: bifunctional methylenetetrahydrofolate dehydrogenase/methenyltetrahydrofolate cyclohydrolase FolD [Thermosulfidibacter takaii]|uniref:Bifunctional protein FolD n=1 Tax=Thermosulfidibacter takaii TaxID=412593 RepID=A0A7C0Y758_9BACT|nr:bifunctional methylenetetrahydrofolate dehydrogenase/methenyltetrahydrofolate cyclohydrolase FolD [Thermosulfidibacter takaii]